MRYRPGSLAGAKLDLEIAVEGLGDPEQGIYARRPPAAFESSDCRLRGRDRVRQFGLGEPELASALGHAVRDPGEEPAVLGVGKSLADPLERLVSSPGGCLTHISNLLYIAWMRYGRSIAIGSYFVVAAVWVYWFLDRQPFFGSDEAAIVVLGTLVLVHLALGFVVARWWAALLTLVPLLLAAPLGYPSANRGEPLPIWLGLLLVWPLAVTLVALGVGARKASRIRRARVST
jgi:hypothetical protein